ncbi:hypothetical protein COT78_01630 [Candidatus Berkelbacteria bacterium CG10_big_fil_rev_8_21_14_0_10_43_13]|uniref:GyrI-like small molecule binding domain-containing protein n=1 Tax=Candidatus Berkelbacteria bacterium CG10_big_fil_rev_8_21_14_0_10_43_13 TaxID=1974514 RepID=A0A2H0W6Q6_9BACT|nr:MAG: hypothetical protein COT78_01630 [Candidatus Berkelbacteria bacterium CG10_big_fil_rev_8_21_14_0_10_43_13]
MKTKKKEICCPKFDPKTYDEKEVAWDNKLFVTDDVRAIMHVPINMGSVITRVSKKIDQAGAAATGEDFLMLSLEESPWKSTQFLAVSKEVEGMKNVKLSGKFLTKVFEGDYKEAKNWYREMQNYVKGKGKEVKKLYFYYTTCPKCAKVYGKNYVVLFAQV